MEAHRLLTSIDERAYHFRRNTFASSIAARSRTAIYQQRLVYLVGRSAMLIDLRERCREEPGRLDSDHYTLCEAIARQLPAVSQPGIQLCLVRHREGKTVAIFQWHALSDPRDVCYLNHRLHADTGQIEVERTPGEAVWRIP